MITAAAALAKLIEQIESADRVGIDTEADSLHSYREKLCLLQLSVPIAFETGTVQAGDAEQQEPRNGCDYRAGVNDFIVDPLINIDLQSLRQTLEAKEIVLHGADYDLRMLRRGLNLVASRIFDTMIAARLLGIREFSLAALVKRYFGRELIKGSQKANWAQRPLPARMAEYAINDVHYLLPLAEKLEVELERCERRDWLRQSCQRAIEQAAVERVRSEDDVWRIRGSGFLRGRSAAVLRALWQWREKEAEMADRPPFHILQNDDLLKAAEKFASGITPDYRYFSARRRQAFREAAQTALETPESKWPASRRRLGTRPSAATVQRAEELRRRRDKSAEELGLEPSFIAPRSTIEAIAADRARTAALLVPWQSELLGISNAAGELAKR
ncbi:MAG TPA: ribonuclease D [Candidatus Udaeobacter sp.]|nr:ribonuclease D [Candidatus Udaeobacter sp.]